MKNKNYRYVLLFITATIFCTIVLQFYWNIKNYNENKTYLTNEVQTALDKSIEYYYVEYLKDNIVSYVGTDNSMDTGKFIKAFTKYGSFKENRVWKDAKKKKKLAQKQDTVAKLTQINFKINSNGKTSEAKLDSIKKELQKELASKNTAIDFPKVALDTFDTQDIKAISIFKGQKKADSIMGLKNLANKVIISMSQDTIELQAVSNALKKELKRKNITIDYKLQHIKSDTVYNSFQPKSNSPLTLSTISKSVYLPKKEAIKIQFSDPVLLVLKRSQTGILLSCLLSLSIISCLLYLLRTINRQKKIDEIKNDLISNITHEFKTPITTISTAIEGLKSFNAENDIEKTNRYLAISGNQLKKLEMMVERLLETASLETDQLTIKKEFTDVLPILEQCVEKHQLNFSDKNIVLLSDFKELHLKIDAFHIENTFSNLLDNALKYGGNTIKIALNSSKTCSTISVEDNGIGIDKSLQKMIFEKFYRIPKGNIHDVKGFGIGLYYSKKIIEKHGGTLELVSNSNPTVFTITLFNEN